MRNMPERKTIEEIGQEVLYDLTMDGKYLNASQESIMRSLCRVTNYWRTDHLKALIRALVARGYLIEAGGGIYALKQIGQTPPEEGQPAELG